MSKISENQPSLLVFNPNFSIFALIFSKYFFHILHFVIPLLRKFKGVQALLKMTITLTYLEDLIFGPEPNSQLLT